MAVVSFDKRKKSELTPVVRELIARIGREFIGYCAKARKTQLRCMACNPLTATLVIEELDVYVYILKKHDMCKIEIHKPFVRKYRDDCQETLLVQVTLP